MTTALDIIKSAMSKIGKLAAGETPSSEDIALCIDRLNGLYGSFENEDVFNYAQIETVATLPANTITRTIGTGLQINVARPVKLLSGNFSRVNNIDYAMDVIDGDTYNAISAKSIIGSIAPSMCFYDGDTTTPTIYFWPYALTSVSIHIVTPMSPGTVADQNTTFNFPPGYRRMVEHNLALEISSDFGINPTPFLVAMASSTKRLLKRTNSRVGDLQLEDYDVGYNRADILSGGNP
jgi:hypothetical protein